jgi:hypothetical protein
LACVVNHTCNSDFENCKFLHTGITTDQHGGGQEDEGSVGGRQTSVTEQFDTSLVDPTVSKHELAPADAKSMTRSPQSGPLCCWGIQLIMQLLVLSSGVTSAGGWSVCMDEGGAGRADSPQIGGHCCSRGPKLLKVDDDDVFYLLLQK